MVDVLGLILAVAVTGANVQDRDGGQLVLRVEGPLSAAGAGVGGWSIRRSTCGMGGEDGSVCARYRLQTKGTDWLFRFAMALDRGANLRMAGQLPSPRSGLRDQSTHERGLDQNRHDPPYGAKARLSILRQVLRDRAGLPYETAAFERFGSHLSFRGPVRRLMERRRPGR